VAATDEETHLNARSLTFAAALLLSLALSPGSRAEQRTLPTWAELMKEMQPIGDASADEYVGRDDPQGRQDYFRFLHEMMSQAYFALQYQDPKYPDFWPMFNQVYTYGFANPDDSYYQAAIEGAGIYRISGVRGTTRIVDFEIGSGEFVPYGKGTLGPTLAHYDLDRDTKRGKGGRFEVILSAERPKYWQGDWWKLAPTATFIWVRQRAYDWKNEVDGRFAIERLDTPAARPRRSAEELGAALRQLPKWTAAWSASLHRMFIKRLRDEGLVNKVVAQDLSKQGGIEGQRYLQGIFEIGADEALIVETAIPTQCRYWGWHLADLYTDTLDWMNRQTHLNGFTARIDKDGKFRAVISAKDPGVPNWLDVVDHRSGMIIGRWKECSSYPQPTVTKVKFSEVHAHLPTVTPAQRDATIRERRAAAQMRRRW
jgi:hypothetical protein